MKKKMVPLSNFLEMLHMRNLFVNSYNAYSHVKGSMQPKAEKKLLRLV